MLEQIVAHLRRHTPDGVELRSTGSARRPSLPGAPEHPGVRAARATHSRRHTAATRSSSDAAGRSPSPSSSRAIGDRLAPARVRPADERHHAPNEFFRLSSFSTGARAMVLFWPRLPEELISSPRRETSARLGSAVRPLRPPARGGARPARASGSRWSRSGSRSSCPATRSPPTSASRPPPTPPPCRRSRSATGSTSRFRSSTGAT